MLYTNPNIDHLPDIAELRDLLMQLQEHYPVLHKKPYERDIADRTRFVLTPLVGGNYSFKPNITCQGLLYHGINSAKRQYYSDFYQLEDHDLKCEILRTEAFLLTAESHPLFSLLKDGIDLGGGKRFVVYNPIGLAACYGYKAPFIQLTSSLDTAIMYATTQITQRDGLRYLNDDKDPKVGTLYVFDLYTTFSKIKGLASVGLQAFERPGRMQEFIYKIDKRTNFNDLRFVRGFTFRHDLEVEKRLLEEIYRPKRADIISAKIQEVYQPKADGKFELPEEVLKRIAAHDKWEKIKVEMSDSIRFVDNGLRRFQFNDSELETANLEQRWNRMVEQIVPTLPSDIRIIEKLIEVPHICQYRRFFDVQEWMDYFERNNNNEQIDF